MANVTATQVKELRERTGVGLMECKKALTEANGDVEQAIEVLRRTSSLKAAAKATRVASEGLVSIATTPSGAVAMADVNCETDFVSADERFIQFTEEVLATITQQTSETGTDDEVAGLGDAMEAKRATLVQTLGENILIRRWVFWQPDGDLLAHYVHRDRIGVLLRLQGANIELGREVAMHIAAMNTRWLDVGDIPQSMLDNERAIYTSQAKETGKAEQIIEKMVEGKVRKFIAENSLLGQPFVKDSKVTVGELVKKSDAKVLAFVRYEIGEGIDKEEVDFGAEVAVQMAQSH